MDTHDSHHSPFGGDRHARNADDTAGVFGKRAGESEPRGNHIDTGDRVGKRDHGSHGGHGGGHGDHASVFRDRFWLSLVFTVPIVWLSPHIQMWFGYSVPDVPGLPWVPPFLGTVVFLYGGWPFLTGALAEIRARQPGMMLLIGMAITVAWVASLSASLGFFDVEVWWELALLIDIMLLGHWMEMRAIGQARGALDALADLLPDTAECIGDDGTPHSVAVSDLTVGDHVLVRPGGRIPADGHIIDGEAAVDESMITGESVPVSRDIDDHVVAASIATDNAIRVEVDAVGEETALAGVQRLVAEAEASSSRSQVLADRAAALLFYVALVAAILTAVVWTLLGQPGDALVRSVTVLIIACPHALGLAIPLVTAIATAKSARNGILIKDRLAMERMRLVDTVLFDKTGTLTTGTHQVIGITTVLSDDDRVLATAAAVESQSEHPLARAVVAAAQDRSLSVPTAQDFTAMAGRGVRAIVDGTPAMVGGPALLRARGLQAPHALLGATGAWTDRGATVLYVVHGTEVVGALALADQPRPESRDAARALHDSGLSVVMVTGDAQQVADSVAADLGIDEVFAEVLPEDKASTVSDLQRRSRTVAMVGDGVNDAPALARADVGIAIGAGTDVAMESAGIVLASDDPRSVVSVRRLSVASYRKMVQNLWWAAGYNIVAIPLAAGVLAWAGFVLPMALGAVLMSLSTIIVAVNAQFLRRVDLSSTPARQR